MKKLVAAALAMLLTLSLGAQKRTATISGYITDESSGETLFDMLPS